MVDTCHPVFRVSVKGAAPYIQCLGSDVPVTGP